MSIYIESLFCTSEINRALNVNYMSREKKNKENKENYTNEKL